MKFLLVVLMISPLLTAAAQAAVKCSSAFSETARKRTALTEEENFTLRAVNGKLEQSLDFQMPEGFDSLQIDVRGLPDRNYVVSALTAENAKGKKKRLILPDWTHLDKNLLSNVDVVRNALDDVESIQTGPYLSPQRSHLGYFLGTAGLSVASNKLSGKIGPGKYQAQISYVGNQKPHEIDVRITYKKKLPAHVEAVLPLQVLFTKARGWDQESPEFQEVIRRVNQILSPANVRVEIEAVTKLRGSFVVKDDLSILKSLSHTLPTTRPALKICLCEKAYTSGVGQIYGIGTAIPGPEPSGKFASSGVIVAIGDKVTTSVQDLGVIVTHEILHYLGLSHTYEKKGHLQDPYADTDAVFSYNIMNPDPVRGLEYPTLSPEQIKSIRNHPLIQLGVSRPAGDSAPAQSNPI